MPEVSVIIPCFNTGSYLAEAIDSVLAQTFDDFEIIVVDDGSTDNTRQVATSYSDPKVRCVYQHNQGLSAARNTGIRYATGNFVMFLDADDLILPTKLARQTELLAANPDCGLAFCDFRYFQDGTPEVLIPHNLEPSDADVLRKLVAGNFFAVHTALVRQSCFKKAGVFCEDLSAVEDWDLWLRMAYAGIRFLYHSEPLALYRRRSGSMRADRANQQRNETLALMRFRDYADAATLERVRWSHHAAYRHALYALVLYQDGRRDAARESLTTAVSLDRRWFIEAGQLIDLVAHHSQPAENSRATPVGPAYVDMVFNDLARLIPELEPTRNKAKAQSFAEAAFAGHAAAQPSRVTANALHAIRYDRTWLNNRGLLSILLQSVIGRETWRRLRRRGHP